MTKKCACFILTLVWLLIIILTQVELTILEEKEERKISYIKSNIASSAKQCVREGNCNEGNITVNDLIEKNYIVEDIKDKIAYYDVSVINTNNYNVEVKEKE